MKGQQLEIIYSTDVISHIDASMVIVEYLKNLGFVGSSSVYLGEKKITLNKVLDTIKKSKSSNFRIEFKDFSFDFGVVASWNHVLILVEDNTETQICNWDKLVESFLNVASFIQARVSDIEYEFWQNAKDPVEYQAHNASYKGLPMKSNGLPPPLEQQEIDISNNPCRRTIKDGYVEAIGAIMWLSDEFWMRVGSSKEKIMEFFPGKFTSVGNKVLRLQVSEGPFKNLENINLQQNLRDLLYSK